MATRFFALLVVLLLLAARTSGRANAADPELRAGLKQLLEVGWKSSFQAIKPAEEEFEQLQADYANDPRPAYALALVQLKHRRYPQAKELLVELVAQSPQDHHARQALIWTLMITKKYEAALVQMDELLELLPAAEDEASTDEGLALAGFMGRIFGFLEGPGAAASPVQAEEILAQRERATAALPTDRRDAFEAGREGVLAKFDELSLSHEDIQAKAKAQQEKDNERTEVRLGAEKEVIASEKANIDAEAQQAEESANQKLGDLSKQLATCGGNLAKVNAAGQVVQANLSAVQSDLNRFSATANTSKDPILRDRAIREIARLRPIAGQFEQEYAILDSQAAALIAQQNEIEAAMAQARSEYAATMQRLGRTANKLRKTEKRIGQDEKKLDKPIKGNTAEARNKAAQVFAFSTYESYPLEKEKQRLLESVK